MAFQFPWTNFHELNLDWFLSKFKQFVNNFLETTATAESVPYGTLPSVTVTGGSLDDDTDIVDPFNFHFKIPAGMGISSLTITYNVTNTDTQPSAGWTTTKPAVNPGQYLWIRQTIILQNGIGKSYTYFVYYPVDGTITNIDAHPTENSSNAVSSGGVWSDLTSLYNLTSDNFAWVETTNTASRDYNTGDYVIINGVLCTITASVANGGTLTEGANYSEIGGSGGIGQRIIDTTATKQLLGLISSNSSPKDFTLTEAHYYLVYTFHNTQQTYNGIYYVIAGSSSLNGRVYPIIDATALTISMNQNVMTMSSSLSQSGRVYAIDIGNYNMT